MPLGLRVATLAALMVATACHATPPATHRGSAPEIQLSLGGYQNDVDKARGDKLGTVYVLPSEQTLRYFADKGIKTFRLPMSWERLQPRIDGPLAPEKVAELDAFLDSADSYGVRFIPDLHSYARRDGLVMGQPGLPTTALASFWGQFAQHYKGRFVGYDIMNEPHDMPNPQVWPKAAQETVDAIRKADRDTTIYVEGDAWSSASRWPEFNGHLDIRDPADHLIYSAHEYFDADTSGQYRKPYAADGATPETGSTRLRPFVDWLRANHRKGHVGEFGVPFADAAWLPVLDSFMDTVNDSRDVLSGVAYWAAGDWADVYPLTVQPAKGGWVDRPQLQILLKKR